IFGKQLPYVVLAMLNFLLMVLLSITVFDVPVKGSFLALSLSALIYCVISTGIGFLASTFTRSQIAALFFTMVVSILPAVQFSGMINPVSSLEGIGRLIGEVYPTTYMLIISRGVFGKALDLADLYTYFVPLMLTVPVVMGLTIMTLKK